jgi:BNR repeat-like domain/Prenyltransferase and squalene oxidase repeat
MTKEDMRFPSSKKNNLASIVKCESDRNIVGGSLPWDTISANSPQESRMRLKVVLALTASLLAGVVRSAEDTRASTASVRSAIDKSLPLLLKGAEGHVANRHCFACHNQTLPVMALTAASARGFIGRPEDLKKQMEHTVNFLDDNRDGYRNGKGQGGQVETAGYALLTLELGRWKPDATTEAVVEYLLQYNSDQDHWRTTSHRPPSEASDFTASYLAIRALRHWGAVSQKDRIDKRMATVRDWFIKTPAQDTEDRVFRLWGLHVAGAENEHVQPAARELIASQRADGGWGQIETMESDAYATGSALAVLHETGKLSPADPVYRRGVDYLVKTQLDDGSWRVKTRSKPFQTYFETGFPHGKDQFISIAASGWATTALALACPLVRETDVPAQRRQIVVSGRAAGGYAAFPDMCRTKSGDLLCVFYSGYGHVSKPNAEWPKGGRIMAVRSSDDGQTWSEPVVVSDTVHDDRDPHIAALHDGTLLCNWFATAHPNQPFAHRKPHALFLARSSDNGKTWREPEEIKLDSPDWFACSAPVRELPDRSLILGLYTENVNRICGATIKSADGGRSWTHLVLIGEHAGLHLDAETDVIRLKDGRLLAALRSSKTNLHFATSTDEGKTWGAVYSSGFKGHCPYFLRHSSGAILLAHRLPATAVHWSFDEGKTWQGPLQIDDVIGAYPSCVELPDGRVYCVYYEEGAGSSIRAVRLKVSQTGVTLDSSPN